MENSCFFSVQCVVKIKVLHFSASTYQRLQFLCFLLLSDIFYEKLYKKFYEIFLSIRGINNLLYV